MKHFLLGLLLAAVAAPLAYAGPPAAPAEVSWSVWGGEVGVHWNRDLAGDIGLHIATPNSRMADTVDHHFERFAVRQSGALEFRLDGNKFRGFSGGSLQARGGYVIDLAGGTIDLRDFRMVPRADNPLLLDLVSADGKAWFYIDRLMYEKTGQDGMLSVRTMDMRISEELAARVGQPIVAGWVVADMELNSEVLTRGAGLQPDAGSCNVTTGANCNFAGAAAPNGGTYQSDLFMKSFSPQYSRCQTCAGPSGTGTVVFTPSSTLRNNVNAGTPAVTVSGQGALGTSTANWAADIPWFTMFSGNFPPYGNDQHPFLIWNMYRINADGSIEQIGRSGVKHAFLTTNVSCADGRSSGHVIGAACEDTYAVSNNDDNTRLGPRTEIIPATNQWGRCGSIYDADCNGTNDHPTVGSYDYRLKVGESQISLTAHPGSTFVFESWYLAREDVNIYNSMGTVATTQNWSGSVWGISSSGYKLGSAIDRWVDPTTPPANTKNTEISVGEGHAKLAVKATDNGDGTWRYDYAVMNLDYARATTLGTEPNLKVLSNKGFDSFSVPLPSGAVVGATRFSDGDLVAANDWSVSTTGDVATWTAPAAGPTLDWGTLYTFSITVNAAPALLNGTLHVAQSGSPASYDVLTLGPGTGAPAPTAAVSASNLPISVVQNASGNATFTVGNTGGVGSTLNYTIDFAPSTCASPAAVAWLSAAPTSGSVAQGATADTITTTANATGLAPGSYSAKVCVHTNDLAHPLITVSVALTVTALPPTAAVSTGTLSLSAIAGTSTNGTFGLSNTGAVGSTLHYTIDATTPAWLSAAPASGSIAQGAPSTSITATANAATLAAGSYSGTINVHSDDATNPIVPVTVSLTVTAPVPAATASAASLSFALVQGANGNSTFTLGNSGDAGSVLHYTVDTAASSCASPGPVAWLGRAPASGSVAQGSPAATITASADASSLAPGSYSALICVHTDDPAHALITVNVGLAVSLSDVIFVDGFDTAH